MADYKSTVNIDVNGIEDLQTAEKLLDSIKSKAGTINVNLGGKGGSGSGGKGGSGGGDSIAAETRRMIGYQSSLTKVAAAQMQYSMITQNAENKIAKSYKNSGQFMTDYRTSLDRLTQAKANYEKSVAAEDDYKTQDLYLKNYLQTLGNVQKMESKIRADGGFVEDDRKIAQSQMQMSKWIDRNGKAMRVYGDEIKNWQKQMVSGISTADSDKLQTQFAKIQKGTIDRGLLGQSLTQSIGNSFKQAWQSYGKTMLATQTVRWVSSAVSELKQVDSILTEINKVSTLTTRQLKELGQSSFGVASHYGRTAADYLYGVQEFSRAGFRGEQATGLAELSLKAQAAGDLTADVANSYLLASDAAYHYGGNVEKLTTLLDGQNWVNYASPAA